MRMAGLLGGRSPGALSREAVQSASSSAAACARNAPAIAHHHPDFVPPKRD